MEHSEEKKPFLACLMAVVLMLGGCAFLGQQTTPEQRVGDRTNTSTQSQTTTLDAAPDEPFLYGSKIEFTPPSWW